MFTHTYAHVRTKAGYACRSTISRAHNRPSSLSPFEKPPPFVLADLTYTSCSPSAILFLSGRAVHRRKHGRMPPHMGQTMADTRGPCPLFARSCFDEVGLRPHNALTFFWYPLLLLNFFLFCVFFLLAFFSSLSRYFLPSVSMFGLQSLNILLFLKNSCFQ